jgi:hypothetical protein
MKPLYHNVIGLALALAVPAALAQGLLDGRKYVGDIGDKGKGAEERGAVFTFANGAFSSSVCDKYGFEKGAYTATPEGDTIRFEAKTVSSEHGTNHWTGTVRGGSIEGVLVWQRKPSFFRPSPAPAEKWFKAKLM